MPDSTQATPSPAAKAAAQSKAEGHAWVTGTAAPGPPATTVGLAPSEADGATAAGADASRLVLALELLLVVSWALVIGRPYLDLDPAVVPIGREYLSNIQTHHLWTRAAECGLCALWNGSFRGGYPALADPHGSMLHPLVMLTTLGWGVINGSKLAVVGAFALAGLAQWWLGYVLGLGSVARVWSAAMSVAAGHLVGRMEPGNFGLTLSTAACALALPPLIMLARSSSRRAAVLLGLALGQAAMAGQAYMQLGLALLLPTALVLVPWQRDRLVLVARRFILAAGLAVLLSGPLLIPLVHFLPQFGKDVDPAFRSAQPFAYVPLNLVIDDPRFYQVETLGKLPFPYLYTLFVGWIPVALAIWAVTQKHRSDELRAVLFLCAFALSAFWLASATLLVWVSQAAPIPLVSEWLTGLRYPPVIAGLAVPAVLALAGIGLERLLAAPWPRIQLAPGNDAGATRGPSLDARLLALIPLLFALLEGRTFASHWTTTHRLDPGVEQMAQALRTPDLQWVDTPFGEQFWIESAVRAGLKLSLGTQGWYWKGRPPPEPVREANRLGPPLGTVHQGVIAGVPVFTTPSGREYASIAYDDGGRSVCGARGTGGDIAVTCTSARSGRLLVKENNWSGWGAWLDGQPLRLRNSQWLEAEVPAGTFTVELRYRPWDVFLGLGLLIAGIGLAAYAWRWSE